MNAPILFDEEVVVTDYIEIHWTSGSIDEARKVSRYLVQERYVASAEIIPWIESIYMWNNQLETTQESKVVFMSKKDNFAIVKKIIEENSCYQIPEITAFEIQLGNQAYLDWINESTPKLPAHH